MLSCTLLHRTIIFFVFTFLLALPASWVFLLFSSKGSSSHQQNHLFLDFPFHSSEEVLLDLMSWPWLSALSFYIFLLIDTRVLAIMTWIASIVVGTQDNEILPEKHCWSGPPLLTHKYLGIIRAGFKLQLDFTFICRHALGITLLLRHRSWMFLRGTTLSSSDRNN